MANETWKFVQAKSKQAMKQVSLLGIRDEKTRMKVTPPLAVAPLAQEDDMRYAMELPYGTRTTTTTSPK